MMRAGRSWRLLVLGGLAVASVARADAPARVAAPAASTAAVSAGPDASAGAPSSGARPAAAIAEPDLAAVEAGDANLEPTGRRGMVFAGSVGGGLFVGFGIKDSVGRGGAVSFRLGRVATPHTVLTLEFDGAASLHRPPGEGIATNTNTDLLVGAQHYIGPSVWLRFAGGLGVYKGSRVALESGGLGDVMLTGPTALAGFGIQLVRFKWSVLEIDAAISAMVNGDGVLVASSTSLGLSFE